MKNVIYSKFSCERKKEFQIVTKIEEENNIRHIQKQALSKEGYAHIGTLVEKMDKLIHSESYRNVCIVKSELTDKGTVELEYISGRTFEEIVNEKAKPENTDELIKIIKAFFNMFEAKNKFEYTEGFKKVFGDIELKEEYLCTDVSNIDLLFSNVIVSDGKYYVSDYEWVFDFTVPFKYIIFRSIAFNIMISQIGRDNIDKLYRSFGISQEEIDIFYKMEMNFQKYVSGVKVLDEYRKRNENIILPANFINIRKNVYSVLLLCGNSVIEKKYFYKSDFSAEFCIDNISEDITVRFGDGQAIIKLEKITAYKHGKPYTPKYKGNEAFHVNENYYFKDEHSELYIVNDGMEKLEIKVIMYYTGMGIIGDYIDKIFEANDINDKLNYANNELNNVRGQLMLANGDKEELMRKNNNYQQEINYLHSKAWFKVYFKLKALKDKLFKH